MGESAVADVIDSTAINSISSPSANLEEKELEIDNNSKIEKALVKKELVLRHPKIENKL